MAVMAAGAGEHDPETDYVSPVFTGPRKVGYEQHMGVYFVHHALTLYGMSNDEIATKFNLELSRAARPMPDRRAAVTSFVAMHRRHAMAVMNVLKQQMAAAAERQLLGQLEPTCLLAKMGQLEHLRLPWQVYAERIADILQRSLPRACKDKNARPKTEPKLQELCDSLLVAAGEDLVREFPYLRWASSLTKPDWSDEKENVWVELKYVRKRADLVPITDAIAGDITKYGDNGRRTLFVVYDPDHVIPSDSDFAQPVESRPAMMVRFIR